ncbi:MAG: hypothetical protein VX498_07380, partial [Myxococcota bacterium]|nr:hypothetical protein [Myxococcota bacterium]
MNGDAYRWIDLRGKRQAFLAMSGVLLQPAACLLLLSSLLFAPSLAWGTTCPAPGQELFPPPVVPPEAVPPYVIDDTVDFVVGEGIFLDLEARTSHLDFRVEIEWAKAPTDCLDPDQEGLVDYGEVGFTLRRSDGATLPLVESGDWTNTEGLGTVVTSFRDLGETNPLPVALSAPFTDVFLPAGGSLDDLVDLVGPGSGTWDLLATDTAPGSPLCVFDWSLTIAHNSELTVWGAQPPVVDPQPEGEWSGLETVDGTS